MSLSSAAVSPQRARDPAGQRVLIGGGVARLPTLVALRALAGDRVEVTIPAPDLKFIDRSISTMQPFNPKRVGLRLQDTASAVGARWGRRSLDRLEHAGHRKRRGTLGQGAVDVRRPDSQRWCGIARPRVRANAKAE